MKKYLGWTLAAIGLSAVAAGVARAHPIDLPCPQPNGKCQPIVAELGLDDPDFFECHRQYWHERRTLDLRIREYTFCGGEVNHIHKLIGWPPVVLQPEIYGYWDTEVPAHPVVDKPGNISYCQGQIQAAQDTLFTATVFRDSCRLYRDMITTLFLGGI